MIPREDKMVLSLYVCLNALGRCVGRDGFIIESRSSVMLSEAICVARLVNHQL